MPMVADLYSVWSPDMIAVIVIVIGEDTYIDLANEVRDHLDYLMEIVVYLVLKTYFHLGPY